MSANKQPEPDFEGELPADFAALGEQLLCDAQRLSSVYPACQPPTKLMAALAVSAQPWWSRQKTLALVSSAAALLLVAGLIAVAISPGMFPVAHEEPAADPTMPANNALVQLPPSLPIHNPDLQPVSFRPAVMDVNGPELEGLLDLWQEQPPAVGSISF